MNFELLNLTLTGDYVSSERGSGVFLLSVYSLVSNYNHNASRSHDWTSFEHENLGVHKNVYDLVVHR